MARDFLGRLPERLVLRRRRIECLISLGLLDRRRERLPRAVERLLRSRLLSALRCRRVLLSRLIALRTRGIKQSSVEHPLHAESNEQRTHAEADQFVHKGGTLWGA